MIMEDTVTTGVNMSKEEERRRLKLICSLVRPAKIYEVAFATVSDTDWAASVALQSGADKRFRYTQGRLIDEATIGDARI